MMNSEPLSRSGSFATAAAQRAHYAAIRARLFNPGVVPKLRPKPRTVYCGPRPAPVALPYIVRHPRPRDFILLGRPAVATSTDWLKITEEVLAKHRLQFVEAFSHRRSLELVACRHEVFYRLASETTMSLPQIGRRFGFDHTTVISGIKRHAERMRAP